MLIKRKTDLTEHDVTPFELYKERRRFIKAGVAATAALGFPWLAQARLTLGKITSGPFSTDEEKTPYKDVTTYNNFYEFGTDKAPDGHCRQGQGPHLHGVPALVQRQLQVGHTQRSEGVDGGVEHRRHRARHRALAQGL